MPEWGLGWRTQPGSATVALEDSLRALLPDAATLEVLSEFVLPIGPLSAAGLHNYYTGEASSV